MTAHQRFHGTGIPAGTPHDVQHRSRQVDGPVEIGPRAPEASCCYLSARHGLSGACGVGLQELLDERRVQAHRVGQ
jgi:hypothetical protein